MASETIFGACMTSRHTHIQTHQSSSGDTCMRELEQRPQKAHTGAVKGDESSLRHNEFIVLFLFQVKVYSTGVFLFFFLFSQSVSSKCKVTNLGFAATLA